MTFIKRISVSKLLCDSSKEEDGGVGNLYYVNWFNWKDETGQTPHVCYSKIVRRRVQSKLRNRTVMIKSPSPMRGSFCRAECRSGSPFNIPNITAYHNADTDHSDNAYLADKAYSYQEYPCFQSVRSIYRDLSQLIAGSVKRLFPTHAHSDSTYAP